MTKDLSLVIACYNEEPILAESIREITSVLDATRYSYEVILVDDKSKDNTREIIKALVGQYKDMRYIFHKRNTGRGGAVTDGILDARGTIVGFIDIDLETPAHYIPLMVQRVLNGADIATAWRIYKFHFHSLLRFITGKGYHELTRIMLKTRLKDTETGCKFFNREKILPILKQCRDQHWFWDTEIMVRAERAGLRIEEIPTLFSRRLDVQSTVKLWRDSYLYFKNLIRFRRELKNRDKHT